MTHRTSQPMAVLLFGLLAGAAGALLFAPRSGRETREKMKEAGQRWKEDSMQAKEQLVHKVKSGIDRVSKEVSDKAEEVSDKAQTVRGRAKKNVNDMNRATPYTDSMEG